jgi:membrane-associated phospholipid phosphatase
VQRLNIPDVPDASAVWLRDLLAPFAAAPLETGAVLAVVGEVALIVIAVVWVRLWLLARAASPRTLAAVAGVPVAAALAWPVGEAAKSVLRVDRPCRLLDGLPAWVECPPAGDWSFPSNHAAVAGALAVTVVVAVRHLRKPIVAILSMLAAGVAAASRVLAGAHFPHDVVVGLLLGGIVAVVSMQMTRRPMESAVAAARSKGRVSLLVGGARGATYER